MTDNIPLPNSEKKLKVLEEVQRAMINILEDFTAERQQLEAVLKATVNILEDYGSERNKLEQLQRGTLNILEDFHAEKSNPSRGSRRPDLLLEVVEMA